ncbi:putative peptide transporter [Hesseltinella vesiculosa]|uniref:Putative peptide transporter n=1 Tax=Hesseltinella vesiculosa TaxID=101127 RepID=A0A1X2GU18_9FUNG|nr:putative peptide transporter [Hesseltinella vesiculosa]
MSKESKTDIDPTNVEVTTVINDESSVNVNDVTSLRRVTESIPVAAWFILINELCERLSYYGGSALFQNYVQFSMSDDPQGKLARGQSMATALQNFFTFFCYVTPMLGAIVADQYLGRYWTIIFFSIIYLVGWVVLTTTSLDSVPVSSAFPGYIVSLIILGLGTGGIKGIVSPMCADQYKHDRDYVKELPNGELVLVDYTLSIQSLYNWFYFAINVGSIIGGLACPYLQLYVGFWAAYLLPTCFFVAAILAFLAGSPFYVKPKPNGSIIVTAWKVFVFAWKQARVSGNEMARKKCRDFLEFAKRDTSDIGEAVVPWTAEQEEHAALWTDTFVDELKQAVMACRIFLPLSIYWLCYNNLNNNLISQAAQMNRPNGLPNNVLLVFDPILLVIFIPIVDLFFYPALRKMKINFFPQQRITVGFFLGSLSMVYAAVLQYYIYKDAAYIETGVASISVFLQVPAYCLIAFSEIFASITSIEYAYTHAPKSCKSLVSACSLFPNCVAALLGMALAPVSEDPKMVWTYSGIAIAAFVFGILYYLTFRHYDDLDEEFRLKQLLKNSEEIHIDRHVEMDVKEKF